MSTEKRYNEYVRESDEISDDDIILFGNSGFENFPLVKRKASDIKKYVGLSGTSGGGSSGTSGTSGSSGTSGAFDPNQITLTENFSNILVEDSNSLQKYEK